MDLTPASLSEKNASTESVVTTTASPIFTSIPPPGVSQETVIEGSVSSIHHPLMEDYTNAPSGPIPLVIHSSNESYAINQGQQQIDATMCTSEPSDINQTDVVMSNVNKFIAGEDNNMPMEIASSNLELPFLENPNVSSREALSENLSDSAEVVAQLLPASAKASPSKEDLFSSATEGEGLERVSPIQLVGTPDGTLKIKDGSDSTTSHQSRLSSQSSNTSKGVLPKHRRGPKSKKKRSLPKDEWEHDKNDFYCWICHKDGEVLCCELCPRVMHARCLRIASEPEGDWHCPECSKVMGAESQETQSRAMSRLSTDQLALHLRYALQRMKTTGCDPFLEPVNTKEFPDYLGYVFHPMDLTTLEKNIKKKSYGCTEAFLADVKWILHNCIIYNGQNTKLTQIAKTMVKIAEHEMKEIEVCPECYLNSCRKRDNWFCEPCQDIHALVWAKLQGFPHWPAKALRIDNGQVDVRFFGQHDRAWISLSNCYLMSKEMPHPVKNKKKGRGPGAKGGLDNATQEMQLYIDNVVRKTGSFDYAPPRTPLPEEILYRKLTESQDAEKLSVLTSLDDQDKPTTSLATTKMQEDKEKQSVASVKPSSATSTNLVATVDPQMKVKSLSTSSTPKKSKPRMPKKKASHRDTADSGSDESSTDSDSSIESEITATAADAGISEQGGEKKAVSVAKQEEKKEKQLEMDLDASAEPVADAPDIESLASKKDGSVSALLEKGLAKVKKRTEGDAGSKLAIKTKSILLNKEAVSSRPGGISRSSDNGNAGTKRKLPDDNIQGGKSRRLDASSNSTKPPALFKEKKKDGDKARRQDSHSLKSKKEGIHPSHPGINPKKPLSEVTVKKKTLDSTKVRPDDPQEKSGLKSAAKLLAKRMATRKLEPTQGKVKSSIQTGNKVPVESVTKKLSSFTIPKHKSSSNKSEAEPSAHIANIKGGPPSMQHPVPSEGSHPTRIMPSVNVPMQKLKKYNDKVMQCMQQVLANMYEDMLMMFESTQVYPQTNYEGPTESASSLQVSKLTSELERLKRMHQQEVTEMQHHQDLKIAQVRQSCEKERVHMLDAARRKSEAEKARAIEETKKKQWCANCGKEAIFYCCWNTSYCDYPCQVRHWSKHMTTCSQAADRGATAPSGSKQQVSSSPGSTPTNAVAPENPKHASTMPEPVTETQDINNNEDDHSDNDMMIIDETVHKEAIDPDGQSPQREVASSQMSGNSPATEGLTKLSTDKSVRHSPSPPQPLSGAMVSALTSETKTKTAPIKPSSTAAFTPASPIPAKVVPAKLIDDIFSKVHKETSSDTASAASLRFSGPSTSSPHSQSSSAHDGRVHSSGNVISAIGERLLKAKSKPSGSGSLPGADLKTATITEDGEQTKVDERLSMRNPTENDPVTSVSQPDLSLPCKTEVEILSQSLTPEMSTEAESISTESSICVTQHQRADDDSPIKSKVLSFSGLMEDDDLIVEETKQEVSFSDEKKLDVEMVPAFEEDVIEQQCEVTISESPSPLITSESSAFDFTYRSPTEPSQVIGENRNEPDHADDAKVSSDFTSSISSTAASDSSSIGVDTSLSSLPLTSASPSNQSADVSTEYDTWMDINASATPTSPD